MAEAMVIRLAQLRVLEDDNSLAVLAIVGPKAETLRDRVLWRHPRIARVLDLKTHTIEPAGKACSSLITSGQEVVYVCLEKDAQAMAMGLSLRFAHHEPSVSVVQTRHRSPLLDVTGVRKDSRVVHSPVIEAVSRMEAQQEGRHIQLARAIHEDYLRRVEADPHALVDPDSLVPWSRLRQELKDQNLAQGSEYAAYLAQINAEIVPSTSLLEEEPFEFTDAELELLAEREHNRWWRQKELEGWTPGDRRERQDPARRVHPMMRPYGELETEEKELDRAVIQDIPRLLAISDCRVIRMSHNSQ